MLLALMFIRFEAIPSIRKLCRRLERRQYARDIREFASDVTPRQTPSASSSHAPAPMPSRASSGNSGTRH